MSTDRQHSIKRPVTHSLIAICRHGALGAYATLFQPRSVLEDDRRRERILTIVLFCICVFLLLLESSVITERLRYGNSNPGITIPYFSIFVIAFLWLYYLTRIGYFKIAAYIFVLVYFVLTLYGSIQFGASMPAGLLSYVLVITMASIVIGSRFGAATALASILSIVTVGLIEHAHGTIHEWRLLPIQVNDLIQYSVFFLLLAAVSWLSNTEMERSLHRARISEGLLKEERDNLELLVEARTKALRETEQDRVSQLSRFAEFGKRSAGLFHDLLGPLGALSLTIGGLHRDDKTQATQAVTNAIDATRRMQQFMDTIRRQLTKEESIQPFSVQHEIEEAIRLLHYQALQAHVSITLEKSEDSTISGDPFKFTQIITNLLANAIESHASSSVKEKVVTVVLTTTPSELLITISDNGVGISPDVLPRIFNTFFTTKTSGIGLGLATVKDIVEKTFNGTIACTSTFGSGTTFTISLPLSHDKNLNNHSINSRETRG